MADIAETYDLLVVGGGKAGKTLAMDWARAGKRVAMVERGMIGGTCINVACIPTKALVTSARAARTLARAEQFGLVAEAPKVDVGLLRAHKSGVVDSMAAGNHKQFLDSGMDLVLGQARFIAERTVEVALNDGGTRVLRGAETVINTGTRPLVPGIPGLADAGALTSDTLLELERLPERLTIIGGGVVGLEFAHMLAAFGSRITLVESGQRLLPREDADIAQAVTDLLTADGIEIIVGSPVTSVERGAHGQVTTTLSSGTRLASDDVLVAVGRAPVTAELGLESAGVKTNEAGFVVVDDRLATSAPHTWAAGDVAGSPQFTHVSLDDYRILKANLSGDNRSTRNRLIPYTIFLTPELARVGLTEEQARTAGHEVRVAKLPVAAIPRARTIRETDGIWKAVVEARTDRVLGVSLLVRDMIIGHPTMSEALSLLFAAFQD